MIISLIVAYDLNRVIGKDNKLPWPRIEEDMKHFHDLTKGHHTLMGRKTHKSIGRPLEGRPNLVLSRDPNLYLPGCTVFSTYDGAAEFAEKAGENMLMVIGGEQVYRTALESTKFPANRIEATEIQIRVEGDTYLPKINEAEWAETAREERLDLNPPLVYRTLERR